MGGGDEYPFILLCGGDNVRMESLRGTIYKPFLDLRDTTLVAKHVARAIKCGHRIIRVVVDSPDPLVDACVAGLAESTESDTQVLVIPGDARTKVVAAVRMTDSPAGAVIALGDTYAWYDSRELIGRLSTDHMCCIAVAEFRLPFGVLHLQDGRVTSFDEKPLTPYVINLGIAALGRGAIDLLMRGVDVASMFTCLAQAGRLAAVLVSGSFLSVDSIEGIALALGSNGAAILSD